MISSRVALATCLYLLLGPAHAAAEATIKWQGYTWYVKSAVSEGPGPNLWSPSNVWVDAKGYLHLKIAKVDGKWACAEIWTDHPLGFGTYQCQVEGPLDKLDRNVVFSMFSYSGPDNVKEIDIEYARWGNIRYPNGNWTVYPNDTQGKQGSTTYEFKLNGSFTTSRYTWTAEGVHYWMLGGRQPIDSLANLMKEWNYRPSDPGRQITQTPMPLHFNLWLFRGQAPTDDKPIEIVVHNFTKE